MQKLFTKRVLSVHANTSSVSSCFPFSNWHFLVLQTMDKLMEEISREKLIVDRCKKSIDRKEPYDLVSMKQQIDISMSKIAAMKMKLFHMQNTNLDTAGPSTSSNISQQILNTQLLFHGAKKMRESLARGENPNEKVLRETEQEIMVLSEKLDLLIQCANKAQSPMTPISVRRTRERSSSRNLPVQVSGLLKIRVTGLADLPNNTKPRSGMYASAFLSQMVKKKKSMFSKHSFRRNHREPAVNDFIVVLHVGGKQVAMMIWNEKKTMIGGDEEEIQLYKSRQIDFEVYHTDSRSLCAIGTMQLESLLDEHDAKCSFASFAHRVVDLMPEGTLHFQTTYSDPEQTMEKKLGEICDDGSLKYSLSFRKSGSIMARSNPRRFRARVAMTPNQFVPASPSIRSRPRKIDSLESYRLHSVIGIGAFGTVQLAQKVDDNMYCAVKIIERDPRTRSFDTPELHILNNIHHPFICSLMASFIENDSLHLVLEFCEAGDLHTHLSRTAHGFTKDQLTYFATSIVLAVEYLHKKLYVHRDLKTENMMLTREGVLKIIDFGLCKKLSSRNERMCDIVGTTTHLAAEIIRREPYGIEMDWWAVGVSLYQLRTREQPFYGTREEEMQSNSRVNKWHPFHDLLIGLMAIHPVARLGYYSTEDVKKHPFFTGVDFDAVLNSTSPPPYIPFLREGLDLEYFDHAYHSELDTSSSSFTSVNSLNRSDLTI
uniref:Protein kinase C n=2 Tax=Caenorhabditis japonica TaxID=281687 RepID=A0A8R1DZ57_CAEJA